MPVMPSANAVMFNAASAGANPSGPADDAEAAIQRAKNLPQATVFDDQYTTPFEVFKGGAASTTCVNVYAQFQPGLARARTRRRTVF